jgi:hypothetical protein
MLEGMVYPRFVIFPKETLIKSDESSLEEYKFDANPLRENLVAKNAEWWLYCSRNSGTRHVLSLIFSWLVVKETVNGKRSKIKCRRKIVKETKELLLRIEEEEDKLFKELISKERIVNLKFDVIFNHWNNLVMVIGSEGNEEFVCYEKVWNGSARADEGHGYIYFKKGNNQGVLLRREHSQNVFRIVVNLVVNDDLIAEVYAHHDMTMKEVMVVIGYEFSWKSMNVAALFCTIRVVVWPGLLCKCVIVNLVDWLLVYLVEVESVFIFANNDDVVQACCNILSVSDGGDYFVVVWNREDGNVRSFVSTALLVGKSLESIFDFYGYSSSTFFADHAYISIYPPGGQIKSTNHTIEHPAVVSGQRSPSSSEDG